MPESIKVFENSLRDYLINAQSDSYNTAQKIQYRYNNLKVYMEPKKNRTPHFCVTVNISAATYTINPVERIEGSLASDDRYVMMWANRPNINGELKKFWIIANQHSSNTIMNNGGSEETLEADSTNKTKNKQNKVEINTSHIVTGAGMKNTMSNTKAKAKALKKKKKMSFEQQIEYQRDLDAKRNIDSERNDL